MIVLTKTETDAAARFVQSLRDPAMRFEEQVGSAGGDPVIAASLAWACLLVRFSAAREVDPAELLSAARTLLGLECPVSRKHLN